MKICILLLALLGAASGQIVSQKRLEAGDIERALQPIRQKYNLPALGGAIVLESGETVVGVEGVRKSGTNVAATAADEWHLGSDTKAMTATMIAHLVEHGPLRWNSSIGEVFGSNGEYF